MRLIKRLPRIFLLISLLTAAALLSCKDNGKPEIDTVSPNAGPIRKEVRKGPICLRLMADKDSMTIAESLVLSLEAEVEEGFEAELPGFGEKLGEFGIKDYREDPPRLTATNKILSRKTYTLEPFLSGEYTIEPMRVRFHKKGEHVKAGAGTSSQDPPGDHEIVTEAIAIKVSSLLEKDQKELTLNPIRGPVSLPSGPFPATLALGLVGAVLAAGGIFLFLRKRMVRGQLQDAPSVPAHELAFAQLQNIIDEKLVERGLYKLFFSKISDVLREYIENRFGIHAPKRTTQEFFAELSLSAPFSPDQRGLLQEFLQECDLVKFAEHRPSDEHVVAALKSCKALIEATRGGRVDSTTSDG